MKQSMFIFRPGAAPVAQTSKSAVSRVSKPAGRANFHNLPTWKSAIQSRFGIGRNPALPLRAAFACLLLSAACLHAQQQTANPWDSLGKYQFGQSREPLALIEEQIRRAAPADYPEIETKLLAVLKAPDTQKDAKRYICRWLGIVGSAYCVPVIASLLTDADLSHPARIALEKLPVPHAGGALRDALPKVKGDLLVGVISSLGVRRDAFAPRFLRRFVTDQDPQVAAATMAALGQIGNDEANRILATARVSKELAQTLANARIVAATRLAQAGDRVQAVGAFRQLMASGQPQPIRIAALNGLLAALPASEAVLLIVNNVQGDDAAMRAATISAYINATDDGLKEAVAAELPNMKPAGQLLLLGVLADLPDVAARKPALAVLQKAADAPLRLAALECLARHGEADDVPLLVSLAAQNSEQSAAAKKTLQRLGKPGVDAALVRLIESPRPAERAVVLDTLAKRRVNSALPTLVRLLQGADTSLAIEAAKAIGELGQPEQLRDVTKVLAGTDAPALRSAAEAAAQGICRRAPDRSACATVVIAAYQQATSPAARATLLPVFLQTGGDAALNQVIAALKDEDAAVKAAAFRTLVSWAEASAGPHLLKIATTATEPAQAIVALRDGCLRLAEMEETPVSQRLTLLRGVLDVAKRPEEKKRAIAALSELPSAGALELLLGCAKEAEMKIDATKAVIKLARNLGAVYTRQCLAALEQIKSQAGADDVRKEAEDAIKAVQAAGQSSEGYILAWMLAGPYTQEAKDGAALFDIAFAPETSGARAEWRPLTGAKNGVVDLGKVMPGENRVAYLQTIITSEKEQAATLELGSDDGIKVWLNGQVVHANNAVRPCTPGQDKAPLKLKSGPNTLLLKITQGGGEWAACARVRGPDGNPLPGILIAPNGE